MTTIMAVESLVKEYPGVRAVDGISFSIEEGTCFGLLGPNGAGKTTTVEIMEGLTLPTSGRVSYRGQTLGANFKNQVGIQFQSTTLQDFLTSQEILELFGGFYPKTLPLPEVVEMCALGEFLHQDNRKLSGGQRQRLFLALALINDPDLIFLDEPTTGLDPQARQNFWKVIQNIKSRNKTVALTTHYMEEAATLCDELIIMDRGGIIAQGSPQHLLRENFSGVWLELPKAQLAPFTEDLPWKTLEHRDVVEIETTDVHQTLHFLMERKVSLTGLRVRSPTLEDLFLDLTGRDLRS